MNSYLINYNRQARKQTGPIYLIITNPVSNSAINKKRPLYARWFSDSIMKKGLIQSELEINLIDKRTLAKLYFENRKISFQWYFLLKKYSTIASLEAVQQNFDDAKLSWKFCSQRFWNLTSYGFGIRIPFPQTQNASFLLWKRCLLALVIVYVR